MFLYHIKYNTHQYGLGVAAVIANNPNEALLILKSMGSLNATPNEYKVTQIKEIGKGYDNNVPDLLSECAIDPNIFIGPKGTKGDTGAKGDKGDTGKEGKSKKNIIVGRTINLKAVGNTYYKGISGIGGDFFKLRDLTQNANVTVKIKDGETFTFQLDASLSISFGQCMNNGIYTVLTYQEELKDGLLNIISDLSYSNVNYIGILDSASPYLYVENGTIKCIPISVTLENASKIYRVRKEKIRRSILAVGEISRTVNIMRIKYKNLSTKIKRAKLLLIKKCRLRYKATRRIAYYSNNRIK